MLEEREDENEDLLAKLSELFGEPEDPPAKSKGTTQQVLELVAIPIISELVAGRPVSLRSLEPLVEPLGFERSIGFALGVGAHRSGANLWLNKGAVQIKKANVLKLIKYVANYDALYAACGFENSAAFYKAVGKLP